MDINRKLQITHAKREKKKHEAPNLPTAYLNSHRDASARRHCSQPPRRIAQRVSRSKRQNHMHRPYNNARISMALEVKINASVYLYCVLAKKEP